MNLSSRRTVDPDSYEGTVQLTAEDLAVAFDAQTDPDEQLLYDFTRKWESRPISERLLILSRIAALREAQAPAESIIVTGSNEPT